jgi:hypothetical protein
VAAPDPAETPTTSPTSIKDHDLRLSTRWTHVTRRARPSVTADVGPTVTQAGRHPLGGDSRRCLKARASEAGSVTITVVCRVRLIGQAHVAAAWVPGGFRGCRDAKAVRHDAGHAPVRDITPQSRARPSSRGGSFVLPNEGKGERRKDSAAEPQSCRAGESYKWRECVDSRCCSGSSLLH